MEDGQRASWEVISYLMVRDLHPLAVSRLREPKLNGPSKLTLPMGIEPTFPGYIPGVLSQLNYGLIRQTARISLCNLRTRSCAEDSAMARFGKGRWTSDVIERRQSMLGIEPRALEFSPKTLRPPVFGGG